MTMNRRSRRTLLVAALLTGGILVAGCGTQQAGSAAILGDSKITEQQLNSQVREVLLAQRKPADAADQVLTSKTLGRMITTDLANTLAEQNGVVVTQGEIDQQLVEYDTQLGGREAVLQAFAEQDIAPSQIEAVVRLNLQAQALGIKLDPQGSAESQGQAVFDAVKVLSDELEVTTSPRFGTWDAPSLALGPALDDLSAPPALPQ